MNLRRKNNMYTIVRDNERSYAIDIISFINSVASKYNMYIKKAGGERTISVKNELNLKVAENEESVILDKNINYVKKIMFPDVILYGDDKKTKILQGWELKLPDTLITDDTFIKDAQRKAVALGLKSCFIWNFTAGVLYTQNDAGIFKIYKQWNNTNHIRTRNDVEKYRNDWEKEISNILIEINEYFLSGDISGTSLGEIISDTVVSNILLRNKYLVADSLKKYTISDTIADAYIEQWWKEFEKEYSKDEPNKYLAYAKLIILNWTNRIIFAHLIKKYHNEAGKISYLSKHITIKQANDIFDEITKSCDFYSIFSELMYNYCMPLDTWLELIELNDFLCENGIDEIEQTSLQTILETTVSTAKRELAGQYTTPSGLAEILAKITIINLNGDVIDPCCGTGSISKEVLLYKKHKIGIERSINTTWASDKYEYPLQVANISLTSPESINIPNKIFKNNALSLNNIESIDIINPINGSTIKIEIPLFDTVLSNLPFIPFEIIKSDDVKLINDIIVEVKENTTYQLSQKSDIYCFIIFALHKILAKNGRAGFITSNSWLGTVWGKDFYKALNYYYNVDQIHISGNERWFNNAQVVTVILILTHKSIIKKPNKTDTTMFYVWKKSLDEISVDNELKSCIVTSSLLNKNHDEDVIKLSRYDNDTIENILKLNISLNALFHDVEWINCIKEDLIPIKDVFHIIRGERRGWDKMFYPEDGHGIEKIYVRKVLKNAKSIKSLIANADSDAFCCGESMDVLENKNLSGTIRWIKKFENELNNSGIPLIKSLARSKMFWYEMKDTSTADICTTMNPGERLFYAKFNEPTFINQRLIGLKVKENYSDIELNHALLNSIMGIFYIEAVGFGRGLGALDINKESINNAFMLNPNKITSSDREIILKCFKPLLNRKIKTTQEELNEDDRKIFDMAVLRAYGIEKHYEDIRTSILSMQKARLSV
jgi:hypothetical protein